MVDKSYEICKECGHWHGLYEVKVRQQYKTFDERILWTTAIKYWCHICNKYVETTLMR